MLEPANAAVTAALAARGVTEVVHITPARNVPGILGDEAIRSVAEMGNDARAVYAPNDLQRLDGHRDKVSFSLQYPNAYYLRQVKARGEAINFPDWVCFLLSPAVAAIPGSLFCPRNAGAYGGSKEAGVGGLDACYAPVVSGAGGTTYRRGMRHDPRCPTDVQAEVLVPAPIPLAYAHGIVFPSEQAAANELARLDQLVVPIPNHLQWIISPGMFNTVNVTYAVKHSRSIPRWLWASEGIGR